MALSFEQGAALGGALGGIGNFAADKLGYSSSAQARARNAKLLGLDNPQGRLADLATNQQTGEPIIGANNGGIAQLLNPTPTAQQQAPALDRSATPPAPPVPQNVAAPVAPPQPAQSSQSGGAFGSNVKTEDLIAVLRDPDSNEEDKAIAKSILSPRLSQGEGFTLGEGDRRYDAGGHLIASGAPKEHAARAPTVQEFYENGKTVKKQYNEATGGWDAIGEGTPNVRNAPPEFTQERDLRQEFQQRQTTKDFNAVQAAYNKMQAAAADPSSAGDISMIYGFMKLNDPTSVVREGEFATAENAGGVPSQIMNLYNKVLNGTRLPPGVRADFLRKSAQLANAQGKKFNADAQATRKLAQTYKLNPDNVATEAPEFGVPTLAQAGDPNAPPAQPKSAAEYQALPPGATYMAPDGSVRTKQ